MWKLLKRLMFIHMFHLDRSRSTVFKACSFINLVNILSISRCKFTFSFEACTDNKEYAIIFCSVNLVVAIPEMNKDNICMYKSKGNISQQKTAWQGNITPNWKYVLNAFPVIVVGLRVWKDVPLVDKFVTCQHINFISVDVLTTAMYHLTFVIITSNWNSSWVYTEIIIKQCMVG
jgi:hypothetical protein